MFQKAKRSIRLNCPENPTSEKYQRHRQSHVQIGINAAKQGLLDLEAVVGLDSVANRANARNQPSPVCEKNEDKNSGEKPKCFLDKFVPDNSFQKVVQALDKPFPEILRPGGNLLDVARGNLCENNQSDRHYPSHYHRVGNRKRTDPGP